MTRYRRRRSVTSSLSHEEDIAIERIEGRQRFVDGEGSVLPGWTADIGPGAGGCFEPNVVAPLMIDGEIARDPEDPHPALVVRGRDGLGARDPQEHILRQVACRLGLTHCAAQIPQQARLVSCKERFGVGEGSHLHRRTDDPRDRRNKSMPTPTPDPRSPTP
jgi:hypothetical protein